MTWESENVAISASIVGLVACFPISSWSKIKFITYPIQVPVRQLQVGKNVYSII